MKNTIPVLPPRAMDMIRELCFMSALGIDQIAKETGLHGYQQQLAKLYITVFEEVLDAEEESK